jgi:hypothetical protein
VNALGADARPSAQADKVLRLWEICGQGRALETPFYTSGPPYQEVPEGYRIILAVAQAGAIPPLIRLMKAACADEVRHHAAVTLLFLASYRECATEIAGTPGAIQAFLTRWLGTDATYETQSVAVTSLSLLTGFAGRPGLDVAETEYDTDCVGEADMSRFDSCVPRCVEMLKAETDPTLQATAMDMLFDLTERGGATMRERVYNAGASLHLVRLLKPAAGQPGSTAGATHLPRSQELAAYILGHLAHDEATHGVMVAVGAITHLVPLLNPTAMGEYQRPDMQIAAADMLHRFARNEKYASLMGTTCVLPRLKEMLDGCGPDPDTTRNIQMAAVAAMKFILRQWCAYHRGQPANSAESYPAWAA